MQVLGAEREAAGVQGAAVTELIAVSARLARAGTHAILSSDWSVAAILSSDWLAQDEAEDGDSDVSEEYYNEPEDVYIQPYRQNGQGQAAAQAQGGAPFRNGHGNSGSRLKPLNERGYGNGSNSSLEYGDI